MELGKPADYRKRKQGKEVDSVASLSEALRCSDGIDGTLVSINLAASALVKLAIPIPLFYLHHYRGTGYEQCWMLHCEKIHYPAQHGYGGTGNHGQSKCSMSVHINLVAVGN